jgi:formylglycine-generating enzyme required for sulfatase activity
MKKVRYGLFAFTLMFVFLVSSCGTPTPLVIVVTATSLPPTEAPAVEPTATLAPVALAGPQAGTKMKWMDGSSLAYVPLSEFIMGNDDFNAPVHKVTLDGYWIYTTKVTNRMYAQCVAVGACTSPTQELGGAVYSNPEFANHPVVGVTWDQSQAYCSWSQGQLPTEAQWEKAAHGENGNPFPWGSDDPACDILSFAYCNASTSEVNAFKDGLSPYGLYDMAGNVFEWVSDWYGESYYKDSAIVNPTGPESGEYRVIRGSSFESYPDQINLGIRHFNAGSNHRRDVGFRCVVPDPQPVAPFCQLAAFIPTGVVSTEDCQLPAAEIASTYCFTGNGYATIDIPPGSVYESGKDLACLEAVVDGKRRLTCMGPRSKESTNEITVCNPSCSNSPDMTGAAPTCDPGYTLDAANSACNYTIAAVNKRV